MFGKKVNEEDFNNIDLGEFEEKYSEKGLWEKIQGNLAAIGAGLVYKALQLFYVAQSPQCPMKIKAAIYGALGYLISPLDLIRISRRSWGIQTMRWLWGRRCSWRSSISPTRSRSRRGRRFAACSAKRSCGSWRKKRRDWRLADEEGGGLPPPCFTSRAMSRRAASF